MRVLTLVLLAASAATSAAQSAQTPLAPRVAQTPPTAPHPAGGGPQTPADYRFPSGAGMLFFYVKPDKTADFEAIVARIGEVLDRSDDPVRKQQAAHWRVLRSVEALKESAIYVFLFEPAVPTADYDPVKILGEALPAEVHGLYERLIGATVKVERMGLARIR